MKELFTALRLFVVMSILTGIIYPLLVTGIAQTVFPHQANGSIVEANGKIVGSSLIGQQFDDPKYLWSRISATSPFAYNAASSSGSNLGPTNPALIGGKDKDNKPIAGAVADRISALKSADPSNDKPIPMDLVTSSGSGLDPHISVEAADYQVSRIAKARKISEEDVRKAVTSATHARQFGLFGEPTVNVLQVNLALDAAGEAH